MECDVGLTSCSTLCGVDKIQKPPAYDEWESTITIDIPESVYIDSLHRAAPQTSDIIFIFEDKLRLSARNVQKKTTHTTTYVAGIYNEQLYPIKRTHSTEELVMLQTTFVEKAIFRQILHHHEGVRISLNREEASYGTRFTCCGEIEYDGNISTYEMVYANERKLMELMEPWRVYIKFDELSLQDIFACIPTKVQVWHCADLTKPYQWAYKYNGVKAKLLFCKERGIVSIWPDSNHIKILSCDHIDSTDFLNCVCIQVEIMESFIVIVEIIGISYQQHIYNVEPKTTIKILKHLKKLFSKSKYTITGQLLNNEVKTYKIYIQTFKKGPLPMNDYIAELSSDENYYDGFIISQNNLMIKWKYPTFDACYIGNKKFVVAENIELTNICIDHAYEIGKIYEISADWMVLRKRIDRIAPSSLNEYRVFLNSLQLLKKNKINN